MKVWLMVSSSFLFVFALTGCASTNIPAKASIPVKVGPVLVDGSVEEEACTLAEVKGLPSSGGGLITVRKGPGVNFDVVDNLTNGQRILYCDYAANGKWAGIVYKTDFDDDCGTSSPISEKCPNTGPCKRTYTGPCKFGWVPYEWLEVIAD